MNRTPIIITPRGVHLGQSQAIERYLARRFGFLGSSDEEAAVLECIAENVRDIRDSYGKARFGAPAGSDRERATDRWLAEDLTTWLPKLEKSLPPNPDSALCMGSSLTYADITIWHLLKDYFGARHVAWVDKCMVVTPRLADICKQVESNPKIADWLKTRPETPI